MSPSFALAAIGRDRPGIVAAVAEVLYEHGCNIEDSSMTLLRGNFSIMLVLAASEGTSSRDLDEALRPVCEEFGLTAAVLDVHEAPGHGEPSHMLTVYGADRPGILYRVTDALARRDVNVTDLVSRLIGDDSPVYALMLELSLPQGLTPDTLEGDLREVAAEVGVDLTLRPAEGDVL